MLEKLKDFPITLKLFFGYLKKNNIEPIIFIKYPFIQQLGYFLDFASISGINIEVNHRGCIVYFSQLGDFIANDTWNEALVIHTRTYDRTLNILGMYEECIYNTFKRLEYPF